MPGARQWLRVGFLSTRKGAHSKKRQRRVVVNVEDFTDRLLIAASEVPGHGDAKRLEGPEHDQVALEKLSRGEDAAQRVVNVRVGPGLEKNDVTPSEPRKQRRQVFQPLPGVGW